jgi:hypothetical protein
MPNDIKTTRKPFSIVYQGDAVYHIAKQLEMESSKKGITRKVQSLEESTF